MAGCASSSNEAEPALTNAETGVLAIETCSLTLDVQAPELVEATTKAAARWAGATGCDVRLSPGGTPVRFASVEELTMPDGKLGRGVTRQGPTGELEFIGYTAADARLPWTVERTVTHEIGHALGCWGHTHESGSSVLDEGWSADAKITAAALECVCASANCAAFQPEA